MSEFSELKLAEKDAKAIKVKLEEQEGQPLTPDQMKEMDEFYNSVFQGKFGNPAEFWKNVFAWQAKQMDEKEKELKETKQCFQPGLDIKDKL